MTEKEEVKMTVSLMSSGSHFLIESALTLFHITVLK